MKPCVNILLLCLLSLLPAPALGAPVPPAPGKLNILFILADDLGWNDLGCCGAKHWATPNLDRLASQGMRFTQANAAAPICSASRAAILTGRSPARLGLEFVTKNPGAKLNATGLLLIPPLFTKHLALEEITVAEALGSGGYRTGFFGKWHLAEHYQRYLGWSPTHGPKQQGFAEAIEDFGGHTYGALANAPLEGPDDLPQGQFPPDSMTDKAIAFLEQQDQRPFCLMVSHFFVHEPIKAPARWLFEQYRKKLNGASDAVAAYGAFVETFDHHVGRLLAAVDRLGLGGNTVVVFTSDNGGAPGYASLAPLRGCKWTLYEGGLRVPLLVRWPGVTREGSVCDTPVTGCDLLPTFCAIGGVQPDAAVPLDGVSLVPLLRGESPGSLTGRPLIWHFPYYNPEPPKRGVRRAVDNNPPRDTLFCPVSAIRRGEYKLVHDYETGRDELFDLARDPTEQRDLAAGHSGLVTGLRSELDAYLRKVKARLPTPNTVPVP